MIECACAICGSIFLRKAWQARVFAGRNQYCSPECKREGLRRWKRANRARVNAADRQWKKAHPEYMRTYLRAYHEANRERLRDRQRAYNEAHRAQLRDSHKRWREANAEKMTGYRLRWKDANRERLAEECAQQYSAEQYGVFAECHRLLIALDAEIRMRVPNKHEREKARRSRK